MLDFHIYLDVLGLIPGCFGFVEIFVSGSCEFGDVLELSNSRSKRLWISDPLDFLNFGGWK